MNLTEVQRRKFNSLASSTKGTFLIEYLEIVKNEVADIRSTIHVKPEFEREVRLAVCDVLDELLINPLKRQVEVTESPDLNENI